MASLSKAIYCFSGVSNMLWQVLGANIIILGGKISLFFCFED